MNKAVKSFMLALLMAAGTSAFAASKKTIVCVTYPEYDWVLNVLGNKAANFNVTLLQDKGTDLHSYQPSMKDIAKISTCDMIVYVGGESDEWVEEAIEEAKNKNKFVVNMMEVLGDRVRPEEMVEGMQAGEHAHHHHHDKDHDHDEHDHDHESAEHEHHHEHEHEHEDHDHEHEHEHHHDEVEYDEHVWLSIKSAAILTKDISEKIQKLDPANASVYKANEAAYVKSLSDLDAQYQKAVAAAAKKTILFGDRFPFRYLADDYNLKYYAAFVGCSAESEASFETIVFLAKKVDELGLKAVLTIEKSDKKIAKTIISNTKNKNQAVLEMDSLQSITQKEIKGGRNYLSAMKKNLEALKEALK